MNAKVTAVALLAGALLLGAGSTSAGETVVTIPSPGGDIVGTMNIGTNDGPNIAVLFLHGFTGTRDELPVAGTDYGVFSLSASLLAERGIPSLRIDARGTGESTALEWPQTRFSTQIADARSAVAYLHEADPDRGVVVLGWSQGGLIAAHVAREPGVAGVVLWAPVARPEQTYSALLGADVVAAAHAAPETEVIEFNLPWGATTSLEAGFFTEFLRTDPVAALAPADVPLLVMVGRHDTTVAPQPAMGELFAIYHSGPSEVVVLDTDHVFGAFEGPALLTEMISTVADWIEGL